MSGETIEDYAARVAPTLHAKAWANYQQLFDDSEWGDADDVADDLVAEARALLAYRDKVAALVNVGHREYFVGSADIREAMMLEWLRDTLRVVDDDGDLTDFGQEIRRALRGTPENVDEDGLCELCGRVHGTGEYMCPEPDGDECMRYGSVVYGQPPGWSEEVDAAYEVVVQHMAKRGLLADGTTPE